MKHEFKCPCGQRFILEALDRPAASRDASADFRINALSHALDETISELSAVNEEYSGNLDLEPWRTVLDTCGAKPISPQYAARAYEKPNEVTATGHKVDKLITFDQLDAACAARHDVRVTQGCHRGEWKEMPRFERGRQHIAMRAALAVLGIMVKDGGLV